jgi:hypothetical protein
MNEFIEKESWGNFISILRPLIEHWGLNWGGTGQISSQRNVRLSQLQF